MDTKINSYFFLAWSPKASEALDPLAFQGESLTETGDIATLFRSSGDFEPQASQVEQISYCYRHDGIFIFLIKTKLDKSPDSKPTLRFLAETTCDAIKLRLGHTHFFHPSRIKSGKHEGAISKIKPIELPNLACNTEDAFIVTGASSITPQSKENIRIVSNEDDVMEKMRFILSNDNLVARLKSSPNSIFRTSGDSSEENHKFRFAILHLRSSFSTCFDKFFSARAAIRKNWISRNLTWIISLILLFSLAYSVHRYMDLTENRSIISNLSPAIIFLTSIFAIWATIVTITSATEQLEKYFYKNFFENLTTTFREVIRNRAFILATIGVSYVAMFDTGTLSFLYSTEIIKDAGIKPIEIPEITKYVDWISVEFNKQISSLMLGTAILFFYLDTYRKRIKIFRLARSTKGLLLFGSIYSGITKKITSENLAHHEIFSSNTDFSNAKEIIMVVEQQERLGMMKSLFIAAILILTSISFAYI